MFKKAFLGTEHFLQPLVLALLSSFLYCFTENPVCDPPASTSFLWQAKPWITPCDAAAGHWLAAYVSWWHLISIFGINLYCFLIWWLIKDKLLWRDFMWWINLNAVDTLLHAKLPTTYFVTVYVTIISVHHMLCRLERCQCGRSCL